MSTILSIETGTDICSVGLSIDGELISLRESVEERNHAKNLAVFIDDILRQSSLNEKLIDAVAVSMGPGSYTGLRIGVSLAKGICYANNIPLISVNSLLSLVECAVEDSENGIVDFDSSADVLLIPMIDARRMEVYTQTYTVLSESISEVEAMVIDESSFDQHKGREVVVFGSGAEKCFEVLNIQHKKLINILPSARGMVKIAHKKFEEKQFEDLAYFEPLYLKNFIGTKAKKNYFK